MTIRTARDARRVAAALYPASTLGDRLQRLRPLICPFEALLPFVPHGARVLDVGCGSGLLLGLLEADGRVSHGVGVDPSAATLARAEAMRATLSAERRAALTFIQGGVADLGQERFDAVTMVDVMHHIPPADQRDAFLHAAACVASNGVMIYKDLLPTPIWRAMANRAHDLALSHQWVHYVAPSMLAEWITASGLTADVMLDLPRLWYAHHAVILRRA